MKRKVSAIIAVACVLTVALMLGILTTHAQDGVTENCSHEPTHAPQAEIELMDKLNGWRLRKKLQPLHRNPDLDKLAMLQASYIAQRMPYVQKAELHTDAYGYGVFERAQALGWEGYDLPELVVAGEIAAYYNNTDGALNFWQHSPPHTKAATEPGFREFGLAVLEKGCWLTQYVVMGGRPYVFPVTVDPETDWMYLTQEESWYAERADYEPIMVKFVDMEGNPLDDTDWQVFSPRMRLPNDLSYTDEFFVAYYDGERVVTSYVNIPEALVFPGKGVPESREIEVEMAELAPDIAPPTADFFTVTGAEDDPNAKYDITLIYNELGATLINTSDVALDLSTLDIVAPISNEIWSAEWLGYYYDGSMREFEPGYCIQMWSFQISSNPPVLPDECELMVSGRSAFRHSSRFWLSGRFEIAYDSVVVKTCATADGKCAFNLPTHEDIVASREAQQESITITNSSGSTTLVPLVAAERGQADSNTERSSNGN